MPYRGKPASLLNFYNHEYIVDQILPAREVHALWGASGVGKTTFVFQLIEEWVQSLPLFGYASFPRPYVYVALDRGRESVMRTLDNMEVKIDIPVLSLISDHIESNPDAIMEYARALVPKVEVLFVDGIASLIPNGKIIDYGAVATFLIGLGRMCEAQNLTFVVIGHTAKTQEGHRYLNPREKAMGSAAWAGYSETHIVMEGIENSPQKKVWVLPRNAVEQEFTFERKNGRLFQVQPYTTMLDIWLATMPNNTDIPLETIINAAAEREISKRAAELWVTKSVNNGRLFRRLRGVYLRPRSQ